ncbi:transposase [Streptomyces violaceusniger]|uniref:Transposase IS701-like DDE domain-containing protein n=1 Tax=Streptomyces violaceusniger TaxID=68280 RepID=A0A4D4KSL3_STRVO|nr:hypothetical protein SVIO_001930 [Streptomyces violaceusniger]
MTDAGYDVTRLAWVLRDLPVELVGRIRGDRVMRLPKPPRLPEDERSAAQARAKVPLRQAADMAPASGHHPHRHRELRQSSASTAMTSAPSSGSTSPAPRRVATY